MGARSYRLRLGGQEHELELAAHQRPAGPQAGRLEVRLDGQVATCEYRLLGPGRLQLVLDGRSLVVRLAADGPARWLAGGGAQARIEPVRARRGGSGGGPQSPEVSPPMPAVVVAVLVEVGQRVARGDPAVVVAAMKMESTLVVGRDGTVAEVRTRVGDKVSPGDVLVRVEPDEPPAEGGE